eukprot:scaffold418855_cov21-Prasinocladus_malaysianus.AAC.1
MMIEQTVTMYVVCWIIAKVLVRRDVSHLNREGCDGLSSGFAGTNLLSFYNARSLYASSPSHQTEHHQPIHLMSNDWKSWHNFLRDGWEAMLAEIVAEMTNDAEWAVLLFASSCVQLVAAFRNCV